MKKLIMWLALKLLTSQELRTLAAKSPKKRTYKTKPKSNSKPDAYSVQRAKEQKMLQQFLMDMKS